ncbi:MAG: aspartyl protease family protein [Planctomycetaceae bacterium]
MPMDSIRRPIIPVIIESPAGRRLIVDALVDTGSDITLFPEDVASNLGIDLTESPARPLSSALGVIADYRSAEVVLELRRGTSELFRWRTSVGFLSRQMVYSIVGTKGFFEFFALRYDASAGQLELLPNAADGA